MSASSDFQSDPFELRLHLPARAEFLPVALATAQAYAEAWALPEARARALAEAVGEAVQNVLQHAFTAEDDGHYQLLGRVRADGLELWVHDQGQPFDPALVPDYRPPSPDTLELPAGLGMHLMRRLVDRCDFLNLGFEGKATRLVQTLPALTQPQPVHAPAATSATDSPPDDSPVVLRWLQASEAVQVAQCVYDAYGYSYAYEQIYIPQSLAQLNARGTILSAVAVHQDHVVGHAALVDDGTSPRRRELAMLVTRRNFRGRAVASQLGEFLIEQATHLALDSVVVDQVTNHPYTQRLCARLGFRSTGWMIGYVPADVQFRAIQDKADSRGSILLGRVGLVAPRQRHLGLPADHPLAAWLGRLYDHLELPVSWAEGTPAETTPTGHPAQGPGRLSVSHDHRLGVARLQPQGWDDESPAALHRALREAGQQQLPVHMLLLPVSAPWLAQALDTAQQLGFIATGLTPDGREDDHLILQRLHGLAIDYSQIVVECPFARRLLDEIEAQVRTPARGGDLGQ